MGAKVGTLGCCLWLGCGQAGSREATQLPATCGSLLGELLETPLGSFPKLPQACRHQSSRRNGGRAIWEVLVSSDLGGSEHLWDLGVPLGPSGGWEYCGWCGDSCGRVVKIDQFPVSACTMVVQVGTSTHLPKVVLGVWSV